MILDTASFRFGYHGAPSDTLEDGRFLGTEVFLAHAKSLAEGFAEAGGRVFFVEQSGVKPLLLDTPEKFAAAWEAREALNLAIDCETLMQENVFNLLECYGNIAQPGNVGITPENFAGYPYDPERARELLADADYDSNNVIKLYAGSHRPSSQSFEAMIEPAPFS